MDMYEDLQNVLDLYQFDSEVTISPLTGGTANKNFLLSSKQGKFVLRKRNEKYSSDAWMDYEDEVIHFLGKRGIPVPVPIANTEGRLRSHADKFRYQLFPFLEGSPFETTNTDQLKGAGTFLGNLHSQLEYFEPTCKKELPRYDDPTYLLTVLETVFPEGSQVFAQQDGKVLNRIRAVVETISEHVPDTVYYSLPQVIIHGDYHPANVLYNGSQICALFDFDWISRQPRLRDIVDGIIYFSGVRRNPVESGDIFSLTQSCKFEIERYLAFIRAYQEGAANSILPEEVIHIPDLIAVRFICSRIQAFSKIPPERYLEMAIQGIEEPLDWLESNRNVFIRDIMREVSVVR